MDVENYISKVLKQNQLSDTVDWLLKSNDQVYYADRHVEEPPADITDRSRAGCKAGIALLKEWHRESPRDSVQELYFSTPMLVVDESWIVPVADESDSKSAPHVKLSIHKSPPPITLPYYRDNSFHDDSFPFPDLLESDVIVTTHPPDEDFESPFRIWTIAIKVASSIPDPAPNSSIPSLTREDCSGLRDSFSQGMSISAAQKLMRARTLAHGMWRLYSDDYPINGIDAWNKSHGWQAAWCLSDEDMVAFGEDVFGNQLVLSGSTTNALLWDHETGRTYDLLVEPIELYETVLDHGLNWIDYYPTGALDVAQVLLPQLSTEQHIHWKQPLVLGGPTKIDNSILIPRSDHLIGHANLWRELGNLKSTT